MLDNPVNDRIFKQMADAYSISCGQQLRAEMEQLERTVPGVTLSEARVEQRVRARLKSSRRSPRYASVIATLAACFALAFLFLVPLLSSLDSESADPALPDDALPTPQGFKVIPLSAPLPAGFSQVGFEQDHGQSIYYIEDVLLDDVVMVLERAGAPPDTAGLVEIDLGGLTAFGTQTDSYSFMTFYIDGVLYTLTSAHDINTLIRLGYGFA